MQIPAPTTSSQLPSFQLEQTGYHCLQVRSNSSSQALGTMQPTKMLSYGATHFWCVYDLGLFFNRAGAYQNAAQACFGGNK